MSEATSSDQVSNEPTSSEKTPSDKAVCAKKASEVSTWANNMRERFRRNKTFIKSIFTDTGKYSKFTYFNIMSFGELQNPEELPTNFIEIKHYRVWVKYMSDASPPRMFENEYDFMQFVVRYLGKIITIGALDDSEWFAQYKNTRKFRDVNLLEYKFWTAEKLGMGLQGSAFKRPAEPDVLWLDQELPEETQYKEEPMPDPHKNKELAKHFCIGHPLFSNTKPKNDEEIELDYVAFRCIVFMNLKIWDPVNESVMKEAAKTLRQYTECPLHALFNPISEDFQKDYEADDKEFYVRHGKAKMVWNKFMIDRVIFYHIMQNMNNFTGRNDHPSLYFEKP